MLRQVPLPLPQTLIRGRLVKVKGRYEMFREMARIQNRSENEKPSSNRQMAYTRTAVVGVQLPGEAPVFRMGFGCDWDVLGMEHGIRRVVRGRRGWALRGD
jgi:hypothetical protein